MDRVLLTDPFTLEDFDLVTAVLPVHDLGILFLQSRLDNRLELFHEAVLPFPKRARVVGADVGYRVDGELRTCTDTHRIDDEAKRRNEAARENCRFSLGRNDTEAMEQTHSSGNISGVWENDQGMEVVNRRNDELETNQNTDPFLDKVDIVTVCTES
jgi:hypothetical protein